MRSGHIVNGLFIAFVTFILGASVIAGCLFPLGMLTGRGAVESREIVPDLVLWNTSRRFSVEQVSNGRGFRGRGNFDEAITRVAIGDDGETAFIEFTGSKGTLFAVFPNRTGLVKPALWNTRGQLEYWPGWLGYVGDAEALARIIGEPGSGSLIGPEFLNPVEFLRRGD